MSINNPRRSLAKHGRGLLEAVATHTHTQKRVCAPTESDLQGVRGRLDRRALLRQVLELREGSE